MLASVLVCIYLEDLVVYACMRFGAPALFGAALPENSPPQSVLSISVGQDAPFRKGMEPNATIVKGVKHGPFTSIDVGTSFDHVDRDLFYSLRFPLKVVQRLQKVCEDKRCDFMPGAWALDLSRNLITGQPLCVPRHPCFGTTQDCLNFLTFITKLAHPSEDYELLLTGVDVPLDHRSRN